jgi:hypothetical protein
MRRQVDCRISHPLVEQDDLTQCPDLVALRGSRRRRLQPAPGRRSSQDFGHLPVRLVGNPQRFRVDLVEYLDQRPELGRLLLGPSSKA